MDRSEITAELVSRLVAEQFPQWAGLAVTPVERGGWDNVTFRLGDELAVRLPSGERYAPKVAKEHRWLPFLAPRLPVAVPESVALGVPGGGFPRPWSVRRWLAGERADVARIDDLVRFAADLASFLAALERIDATDGPAPGAHNFHRGGPLSTYDGGTRDALDVLRGELDARAALRSWEAALAAAWDGRPVWVHGDVAASNLLVADGRLTAVIDFGGCAVGDPACDLAIAWTFLSGASREAFRARLAPDDATWARGRGWALWKALITLAEARTGGVDDTAACRRQGWRHGARAVVDDLIAERG